VVSLLQDYARPNDKISHLIHTGALLRLQREFYLLPSANPPIPLIANQLHRPSYVSKEWALQHYGLLTERVQQITSITIGRAKNIHTPIGTFTYHPVPQRYYAIGIESHIDQQIAFIIASKEKALCDLLVSTRNLRIHSISSMMDYLENFLRIDLDELANFDKNTLEDIILSRYKSDLLKLLLQTITEIQC
jgi:hypothetical protein